jgi:hypothetical protein
MAEPCLEGPRIVAGVRQCEAAGVPQHMRVDWEWHASALPKALNKVRESSLVSSVIKRAKRGESECRAMTAYGIVSGRSLRGRRANRTRRISRTQTGAIK